MLIDFRFKWIKLRCQPLSIFDLWPSKLKPGVTSYYSKDRILRAQSTVKLPFVVLMTIESEKGKNKRENEK